VSRSKLNLRRRNLLPTNNAAIFEVSKTTPPVTVWTMQISGQFAYRGIRIPSLYPGVQW